MPPFAMSARALRLAIGFSCGGVAALPQDAMAQDCGPRWIFIEGFTDDVAGIWTSAMWDPDGPGPKGAVLVAGGSFDIQGVPGAHNIAAWNGSSWTALGTGIADQVHALVGMPNGDLIAGGIFMSAGGVAANRIARWDGQQWSPLGSGVDDHVEALAVLPNGDLAVGGYFTTAGGQEAFGSALWSGSSWSAMGTGWFTIVDDFELLPNGELLGAGGFAPPDVIGNYGVARWTGSGWDLVGTGMDGPVYAVSHHPSGDIIAGGDFWTTGNTPVLAIARWDGIAWNPMSTGIQGTVYELASGQDDIIAGGFLHHNAGGVLARSNLRWDGNAWASMGGYVAEVFLTVTWLPSGELVGGGYRFANGMSGKGIASLVRWTETNIPWVSVEPTPVTLRETGTLTLSCTPADGYTNVSYQWLRNGDPISNGPGGASAGGGTVSGAAGALASPTSHSAATLVIAQTQLSDGGEYSVVFTNPCGSVASSTVTVWVRCVADYDLNSWVNGDDVDLFTLDFTLGVADADVDGNGFVNGDDFDGFMAAYEAGC